MGKTYRIDVYLNHREEELVNYFLKEKMYNGNTFHEVLKSIFYLQLREDKDLYEGLMLKEEE